MESNQGLWIINPWHSPASRCLERVVRALVISSAPVFRKVVMLFLQRHQASIFHLFFQTCISASMLPSGKLSPPHQHPKKKNICFLCLHSNCPECFQANRGLLCFWGIEIVCNWRGRLKAQYWPTHYWVKYLFFLSAENYSSTVCGIKSWTRLWMLITFDRITLQ